MVKFNTSIVNQAPFPDKDDLERGAFFVGKGINIVRTSVGISFVRKKRLIRFFRKSSFIKTNEPCYFR